MCILSLLLEMVEELYKNDLKIFLLFILKFMQNLLRHVLKVLQ